MLMAAGGKTLDLDEIEEVVFGNASAAHRPPKPLTLDVVRELNIGDVPRINSPTPLATREAPPRPTVTKLRASHHNLARLIALGRPRQEVSLVSGYSTTYIATLEKNQDFNELVEHYKFQRDEVFVDVLERMRVLGLSTLDEIQQRLEENPDDWKKRDLMDLAELLLVKGGGGGAPRGAAGVAVQAAAPPPAINITFIKADHTKRLEEHPGLTIELEGREVGDGSKAD